MAISAGIVATAAAASGKVEGSITREGQTFPLTHVAACAPLGSEQVLVYLTDSALDEALLEDEAALVRRVKEGKLRGLRLEIGPAAGREAKQLTGTWLLAPSWGPMLETISVSSSSPVYKSLDRAAATIAADVSYHERPRGMPELGIEAKFSAPIAGADAKTENLQGEAAQRSEPVNALVAYELAVSAADFDGARRHASDAAVSQLEQLHAQNGELYGTMFGTMPWGAPPDGKPAGAPRVTEELLRREVKEVLARGDQAIVTAVDGSTFSLKRTDKVWRVR